jgi:hypothetical protein
VTSVSLDAIVSDATRAESLSADERRAVMLKVAAVMAALAATRPTVSRPIVESADRLLTPEDAAEQFKVSKRWLLHHAYEIPGVRRLSRKTIRFSERALRRHLDGRRA